MILLTVLLILVCNHVQKEYSDIHNLDEALENINEFKKQIKEK